METDSATLRPVLAGTRSASTDADGLLPSSPTIARFPGLRLLGLDEAVPFVLLLLGIAAWSARR